jgi:hypothetical protein
MEQLNRRRVAAGAAALALLAGGGVLAGCGSESSSSSVATTTAADTSTLPANGVEKLSAEEILDTSLAAANAASSVTVKGSFTEGGETIALDLQLGTDATKGSITAEGVTVEIRVTGGKSYFKLSAQDFATVAGQGEDPEVAKAISSLLGDKWIVLSNNEDGDALGALGELGQKDSLLREIFESDGELTVEGTGYAVGAPVVFLEDSEESGTIAIQTVGEPYPVQIMAKEAAGVITFTEWNAPVVVGTPADVIDLDELMNLGGDSGSTTRQAARF